MTSQEWRTKFPSSTQVNNNCLKDIACPECGNREHFGIQGQAVFNVTDEGTDTFGDVEWTEAFVQCRDCDTHGPMVHFRVEGLDDELEKQTNA